MRSSGFRIWELYGRSLKYKKIFADVAESESSYFRTLKPLCPTRWLSRTPAIRCIISQYRAVLNSLRSFSKSGNTDTAAKANGLLDRFEILLLQIVLCLHSTGEPEQSTASRLINTEWNDPKLLKQH
jgi:hypothetical protein